VARVLGNALLGLLAHRPMSGYELARTFERTLAHAWSAHHSQIYPELMRLRAEGLIRVSEEGARRRKTYEPTESGIEAVRTWLATTQPERTERNEAVLRTFLVWLLDERDARTFFLEQIDARSRLLQGFEQTAATAGPIGEVDGDAEFAGRLALEWGLRYERAYIEWWRWAVDALEERSGSRPWGRQVRELRTRLRRSQRVRAAPP
jgi:PadR family transcriptional regulator, regulatory protein AphA